jgi:hypothetical protein
MRAGWMPIAILVVGACAAPRSAHQTAPAPADRLRAALAAHEAGDVPLAAKHAAAIVPDTSTRAGRLALLLQALVALDPRNPGRAPQRGATLAAQYLAAAHDEGDAALGRFLYAMALDQGATPDTSAGLPQLSGRPLAHRLQELERAVARLRTELARIQETLKP